MRQIKLLQDTCEITFTNGSISERDNGLTFLAKKLANTYTHCAVITDQQVHSHYGKLLDSVLKGAGIAFTPIILPPGERTKTLLSANYCWEEMILKNMDRRSCVIALGGGMISDLAGFVAACYMRGVHVINIPTSLLAMVDAAIGGKTAVNLPAGKNLIGCFHQPKEVFICPSFLKTLPTRDFRAGIAEVIKYGVIRDAILFDFLEKNMSAILNRTTDTLETIIRRSCEIKAQVVEEDVADDKDVRAILNWGHTFAHAIESMTEYQTYLHGEAVAIGMNCAAKVSEHLGYATNELTYRQYQLIKKAELPVNLPNISIDQLLYLMESDKKTTSGKINLIVAKKIGKVFRTHDVDKVKIREALSYKR